MILILAFFIAYFLLSKTANLKDVLRIALPFGCYVIDFNKTSATPL